MSNHTPSRPRLTFYFTEWHEGASATVFAVGLDR
jgi:hypothetical protein